MKQLFAITSSVLILSSFCFATEPGSYVTEYYYPQFCLNDSFVVYCTKLYFDSENVDDGDEIEIDTMQPISQLMVGQVYYSKMHYCTLFTDSIIAPIWLGDGRFRDYMSKSIWIGKGGVFICENDLWWKSVECIENMGPNVSDKILWTNINFDGQGFVYEDDGGYYGMPNHQICYVKSISGVFHKQSIKYDGWINGIVPSFKSCLVIDTLCMAFGATPLSNIYEVQGFYNNKEYNQKIIFKRKYNFANKRWVTDDSGYSAAPQAVQEAVEKTMRSINYKVQFQDERKDTREYCSWPRVSPDGEKLLAIYNNRIVNVLNLNDRTKRRDVLYGQPIVAVAWLSANVFSISTIDSLYIVSLNNHNLDRSYPIKAKLFAQLPGTSSVLFVNESNCSLSFINRVTNAITKGPTLPATKWLEPSPDGNNVLLLTGRLGSANNECLLYNVRDSSLHKLKVENANKINRYYCARWLNNQQIVAIVNIEGLVNIATYDAFTGECTHMIENIPCEQMNEDYLEYFDIMKSGEFVAVGPRLFNISK